MSDDIIEQQRRLIEEYKQIVKDKNEMLDHWFEKYRNLASETGFLRMQLSEKCSESAKSEN
jgi:hypothetical protein